MLEVLRDIEEEESAEEIFTEYGIDFETGQLTGDVVTGKEAVRVWAFFALQIQRYRYRIFTWNYGSEAETLIGTNYGRDYTESEIKRFITDCLSVNPYITGIDDFKIKFEGSSLTASFTIQTSYGDTQMTAEFDIGG